MPAPLPEIAALAAVVELLDPVAARPVLRRAIRDLAARLADDAPAARQDLPAALVKARAAGLSHAEIGRRTGTQRSTVSKVFAGRASPGQTAKLAAAVDGQLAPLPASDDDAGLVDWLAGGQPAP